MSTQTKTRTVFPQLEVTAEKSASLRKASGKKTRVVEEPVTLSAVIDNNGPPPGAGGSPSPPTPPPKPPN
jgi:hypothetical protein